MKKEELKEIVRKRINYRETFCNNQKCNDITIVYDGFDMSGFAEAPYNNLEILSRFKDLLTNEDERRGLIFLPIFWKGMGQLHMIGTHDKDVEIIGGTARYSGWSTDEILVDIIINTNPKVLDEDFKVD